MRDLTATPGADWKRVEPRRMLVGRLLARIAARLRRRSLDRAIARGDDPSSSAALAYRAARLTERSSRERLAGAVRGVIEAAVKPPAMPSSRVPPSRPHTSAAREELEGIVELLLSDAPVYAEGVARLEVLLTDGGGPLYSPEYPAALTVELGRICAALEGREEDL